MKDFLEELLDEAGLVIYWVMQGLVAALPAVYIDIALTGTLSAEGFGLGIVAIVISAALRSLRPYWKYFLGPLYYIVFLAIIFKDPGSPTPLWANILAFAFFAIEITILIFDFIVDDSSAYSVAEKFRRKHSATKFVKKGVKSNMSNNTNIPTDTNRSVRPFVVVIVLIIGIIASVLCYTTGKNIGTNIGYDAGYAKGYEAGEEAAYGNGYQDGYEDGESDGYDRGYDSGYDTGSALGKRSDESNYLVSSTSTTYIGNINTGKFHRSSCGYLPYPENQVSFDSREDAIYAGYDPCQRCNP